MGSVIPLHKYWKTAAMSATSHLGDGNWLFLVDYVVRVLRVALLLAVWRVLFENRGAVGGLTLSTVLTYTLIAEVFAQQLNARSGLEDALWESTLVRRFLQPVGIVAQFGAEMAGRWAFHFVCFSLPLLALAPLLGADPRPASPGAGALFVVSLGLAVSVGLALDFVFGALTAAVENNVWLVSYVRNALGTVLSGALLPLSLLPWWLGEVFVWLPFASTASAPLRIYTGTGDALPLMLLQLAWSAALWPLALWLWQANREKLAFHGG